MLTHTQGAFTSILRSCVYRRPGRAGRDGHPANWFFPQSANLCHSSVHSAVITWKRKLEAIPDANNHNKTELLVAELWWDL